MEVGRGASEGVDAQVVPLLLLLVIRGDVRDGGGGWEFEQGRDPLTRLHHARLVNFPTRRNKNNVPHIVEEMQVRRTALECSFSQAV